MWNRCVTVFKDQRMSKIAKQSSTYFKLHSYENNNEAKNLTIFEIQAIQNIFIMQKIQILGTEEKLDDEKKKVKNSKKSTLDGQDNQVEQQSLFAEVNSYITPMMEMNENTKVSDILSYRKNEIKVVCKFQTLFDLFQD